MGRTRSTRGTSILADQSGAVLIMAAVSLPVLLGLGGLAVDAGHLYVVRTKLQSAADAAALAAVVALPDEDVARQRALAYAAKNMPPDDNGVVLVAGDVTIGQWNQATRVFTADTAPDFLEGEANAVRVVTRRSAGNGNPAPTFFARVLGSDWVDVGAVAIAVARTTTIYNEPLLSELDPEALDYNRLSVYCFDAEAADSGESDGRSQMTVIADNAGTTYSFQWPQCAPGETMSFRLYNVRYARSDPSKWDDPSQERYTFHTDTRIVDGLEVYDLDGFEILETVLCDSLEECVPEEEGGVIPTGENRTPEQAQSPCVPGKLMYYGWEDRPPGLGWTDRDYDDIRIIIECPVMMVLRDGTGRLVR